MNVRRNVGGLDEASEGLITRLDAIGDSFPKYTFTLHCHKNLFQFSNFYPSESLVSLSVLLSLNSREVNGSLNN